MVLSACLTIQTRASNAQVAVGVQIRSDCRARLSDSWTLLVLVVFDRFLYFVMSNMTSPELQHVCLLTMALHARPTLFL